MNKTQPAGVGMTPSKTQLGSFIRARRLELGLRQVPLATQCGVSPSEISNLEIGLRKYLDDAKLKKLATALQCDAKELRKLVPVKPDTQPTTELGKFIRSRREELGMTVESFAKKMKMTPQQARRLEIRKNPSIRYKLFNPLVKALNLDSSDVIKFVGTTRKETTSELGQLVRSRRKELGLSIGALAKKMNNVSKQFVNHIELGQVRLSENDETVARLAKALDLDLAKLEALRPERRLKTVNTPSGLGGFLAAKRLELHLTQRELAERAELASSAVSGYETGRLRPSTYMLNKFAKALNCEIPPELIPPPHVRKKGYLKNVGFRIAREGLGKFVTERRLELKLTQAQLAERASVSTVVISGVERGIYHPGSLLIERLTDALECEIPAELITTPQRSARAPRAEQEGFSSSLMVHLSGQSLADLDRIKEFSGIRTNKEIMRKALKITKLLLEKQNDKYTFCLRKEGNIVELELLF